MAYTIDLTVARSRAIYGNRRQTIGKITGPSSYTTGGESLVAGDFGLGVLEQLNTIVLVNAAGTLAVLCSYDYTNNKLQAFWTGAASAAGSQIVAFSPGGGDIKGSANTESPNTDQAAAPTNGVIMKAATSFTTLAGTITPTVQTDVARNICITIQNTSGGPLDLYEGAMTIALVGTFRGAAQTETITLTSTAGNKAVADTKFRYTYGSKPFDTVTAGTITNAGAGGLLCGMGFGSKLGLYVDLLTPAEADVVKLTKNAVNLSPSGIVSTTNMTVNFGALADGDDVAIEFKAGIGAFTAIGFAEVTSLTNLSGYTGRFEAMGK